jgi:hypothetical protein
MFSTLTINSIVAGAILARMPRSVRIACDDILAAPLVLGDVQTNEVIAGRSYAFACVSIQPCSDSLGGAASAL